MLSSRFAIIDVETTEGDPREGRIMEVAVLLHDGHGEQERWTSLVRPRVPISGFVRRITGIEPGMLTGAPSFPRVASRLRAMTRDRVLVAHNVRFDRIALQHEFARTGLPFHPDSICTERLARQLLPQLQHFNLASLCRYFGIPQGRSHCAAFDAEATLALFLRFIDLAGMDRVMACVEPGLPPAEPLAA